jgi:hypothetical protein
MRISLVGSGGGGIIPTVATGVGEMEMGATADLFGIQQLQDAEQVKGSQSRFRKLGGGRYFYYFRCSLPAVVV